MFPKRVSYLGTLENIYRLGKDGQILVVTTKVRTALVFLLAPFGLIFPKAYQGIAS